MQVMLSSDKTEWHVTRKINMLIDQILSDTLTFMNIFEIVVKWLGGGKIRYLRVIYTA